MKNESKSKKMRLNKATIANIKSSEMLDARAGAAQTVKGGTCIECCPSPETFLGGSCLMMCG